MKIVDTRRVSLRAAILGVMCACGGSQQAVIDAPTTGDAAAAGDAVGDAPSNARLVAYVSGYGPNIAWYAVDRTTGALTPSGSIAAFAGSPSFLAVDRGRAFAISESTSRVGAYSVDPSSGTLTFLNAVSTGGTGPAYLSVDRSGKYVFVANYGNGSISVFPILANGQIGAAQQTLAVGANAHMIVSDLSNRYVFVPCLGANYVAQFMFDATTGTLTPNPTPRLATDTGTGPRHLAFAPNGNFAYLINETNSTLSTLALDNTTGRLSALQTVSTRAAGATGSNTTAEVWVHPSGRVVYGSNRGDNNIVTFSIAPATGMVSAIGHTSTGGMTPRDFTLDPGGAFLYAANQASSSVVAFSLDPTTGLPSPTGAHITATMPSYVGIVALP